MIVTVDLASKLPPYAQIKKALLTAVADGSLARGDRLPPIRQLAGDLGVATNTVARAYRELEADQVVASSGRRGTIVLAPPDIDIASQNSETIAEAIRCARRQGLGAASILDVVTRTLAEG